VSLNASNPNVNFKYSVDDIIWKVRTAYATGMYQLYADCLYIENNRGGDIATGNQTPDRVEEIRLELTKQLTKNFFVRNVAPTLVISDAFVQNFFIKFFRKCKQQPQ
jgi:hypothetical protein